MDGEQEPVPPGDTDRHLAGCAACRSWQARAVEVTRLVRVREVTPTPDLSEVILDRAPVPVVRRGWWARAALGVVALAQLGIGLSQILGVHDPAAHSGHTGTLEAGHLFNESTAWNLAVGIGLFWVVLRASAAAGLIPVLGGFVLVLVGFSTHDLITGAAPASRIAEHGLLIAGLVLLVVVRRQQRDPAPGRDDALSEPDRAGSSALPAGTSGPDHRPGDQQNPPLRPVGHHRVA